MRVVILDFSQVTTPIVASGDYVGPSDPGYVVVKVDGKRQICVASQVYWDTNELRLAAVNAHQAYRSALRFAQEKLTESINQLSNQRAVL